jgi:hypothetical protein
MSKSRPARRSTPDLAAERQVEVKNLIGTHGVIYKGK